MVETGNSIVEAGIITRVAEGAITFATGAIYAPVIQGSTADQVKPAADSATTVIGFARKPMTADSIADEDTVDVVTDGSIIQQYVSATVTVGDCLEVHSVVNQLAILTPAADAGAFLIKRVAVVLAPRTKAGLTWVMVRRGY
jgi:hypothetical protein